MGGRVSCFLFRTTVQKLLYFHYEFVHIFEAYALVGPFGGHITIAYIVFLKL